MAELRTQPRVIALRIRSRPVRVLALSALVTIVIALGCGGTTRTEPMRAIETELTDPAASTPSTPRPSVTPVSARTRDESLEGLGGLDMMPGLLDALVPSGCDFDDPMSSCQ